MRPSLKAEFFKSSENKWKQRTFSALFAPTHDDDAGPAVARPPTHFEEVLGVLKECSNPDVGKFHKPRGIRALEQTVALVRVRTRTRKLRGRIVGSRRHKWRRLRWALVRRYRKGAVDIDTGHQKRGQRRSPHGENGGIG